MSYGQRVQIIPEGGGTGAWVDLPLPERITNVRIRDALEALIGQHRLVVEAGAARTKADTAAADAQSIDLEANTLLLTGASSLDGALGGRHPTTAATAARDQLEQAQAQFTAAHRAQTQEFLRLAATVDANADTWRKDLKRDADATMTKLTNVKKALQVALSDLESTVGLLEMLEFNRGRANPNVLAVRPTMGLPELSNALDLLNAGIGTILERLETLT